MLRKWRRRRIWSREFPTEWLAILERRVPAWRWHDDREQTQMKRSIQVFCAEKRWEGCGGLAITDEVRVTIAGYIALLTLGLPGEYFSAVQSILVYPTAYRAEERQVDQSGLVTVRDSGRAGEAWYRGPVILSWEDVQRDGHHPFDGRNLVFHEFAHQLDMQSGQPANGVPKLANAKEAAAWHLVLTAAYQRFLRHCRQRRRLPIYRYGSQGPEEFFAVATETFFERPFDLFGYNRRLYRLLQSLYQQDPCRRFLDYGLVSAGSSSPRSAI